MIYFLVYAGLLLCGLLSRKASSVRMALYYASLLGLFFFVGFRYHVGCDWSGYLNIFNMARYLTIEEIVLQRRESVFWIINRLLHDFKLEYPYINVIAAGLFFMGFHALARRQPDPLGVLILAFPILILNLAMSGIRQGIAVGFICLAYNAFSDARLLRYILWVTIATTFHTSAAFFFILAPFVKGDFSRRSVILGILLALPGAYYMMSTQVFEQYSSKYFGAGSEAAGGPFRAGLLALTGIVFVLLLDRKWYASRQRDHKLVKISSYMLLATFPVSLFSSVIGDRFGYYLNPIQLMILARLPFLLQGPYSSIIAFMPYAAGALVLLAWIWLSTLFAQCYLPYRTWW